MAGAEKDSNSILLKLAIDAHLAAEEATKTVKQIDTVRGNLLQLGKEMENTFGGRLAKGVTTGFIDSFANLVNNEIPRTVRAANLQETVAREVVEGLTKSEFLGKMVEGFLKIDPERMRAKTIATGSQNAFMAITQQGRVDLGENQARDLVQMLGNAFGDQYDRRQRALDKFHRVSDVLPSAAEVHPWETTKKIFKEYPVVWDAISGPAKGALKAMGVIQEAGGGD